MGYYQITDKPIDTDAVLHTEQLEIQHILLTRLICDKCGATMFSTGIVFSTYPPQYEHQCPRCGTLTSSDHVYPQYQLECGNGDIIDL